MKKTEVFLEGTEVSKDEAILVIQDFLSNGKNVKYLFSHPESWKPSYLCYMLGQARSYSQE